MGLFSGAKALVCKSEAAVIVQKLLERQVALGFLGTDPAPSVLANKLVELLWDRNPRIFGTAGVLPHKLAVAAAALSSGVNAMARAGDRQTLLALLASLGTALVELAATGDRLDLHATDLYLIDQAEAVHRHFSEDRGDGGAAR